MEVEYKAAKAFEAILIEDDKFYNLDAVFCDVYYNTLGILSSPANQRAMMIAAEKGDKFGKSWMGETGGRLFRDYAVSTALLIATVASGGAAIPAAIANIYGGLENISKVKRRYNELKSQRLSDEEILAGTAIYAAQIGVICGGSKYMGKIWSEGIVENATTKTQKIVKATMAAVPEQAGSSATGKFQITK